MAFAITLTALSSCALMDLSNFNSSIHLFTTVGVTPVGACVVSVRLTDLLSKVSACVRKYVDDDFAASGPRWGVQACLLGLGLAAAAGFCWSLQAG